MDREQLAQLSEDEKVDLILSLAARIAELEAQLNRPKKTARNSSIPASQQPKAKQRHHAKKRGPKPGHPGKSRPRRDPDHTIECRMAVCHHCGWDLQAVGQCEVGRSQVIELPVIQTVVIEAVRYGVTCPGCGTEHQADYPPGFEPRRTFGPNLEALVVYLREVHHLGYQRLEHLLKGLFGLSISQGALVNILKRVARQVEPVVEGIRQWVRHSPVIGSDETRARVDGHNHWEWVFQTPTLSYHTIRPNRRHQAVTELMGESRVQVWMSDLFSAQVKGARQCAEQLALCGAHQLRNLQYAIDCGDTLFAPAMRQLFLAAKAIAQQRDTLPPELYQQLVQQVHTTCDRLLALSTPHPEAAKLQQRYRRHRPSLFVFLERPDVPFDNNASERALRNSVIHRKVTGGFRSEAGATAFANITTIVQTAHKNGLPVFHTLRRLLIPSPLEVLNST